MSRRSALTFSSINTPASASAASLVTCASSLAKQDRDFAIWASVVGLDINVRSTIPSTQTFQRLNDLKNLSKRFPAWLTDADSPQYQYLPQPWEGVAADLRSDLANASHTISATFHNDVDLNLCSLVVILNTCYHMDSLSIRSRKATEADRRHSLDAMLAYICEVDHNEAPVSYCAEQELKLPQAQFRYYNITKTKADGVVHLDVARFRPYVTHANMTVAATAFCQEGPEEVLQVVHCTAEFKREEDGTHQAMMAMVSGLYQRRVLQMPGQFVFGVFHYQRIHFRVVAGLWQGDTIQLYEIGQYSIIIPMQAVQFYLVLRGIHRLASSYLEELQQFMLDLTSRIMAHPPPRVWLPVRMGGIQENPNESNQQPPHQGGGNTRQETSQQRHARRKVASYLQSISSVSKFESVDSPPTPPIDLPLSPTFDSATPSMEPSGDDSGSSDGETDTIHNLPSYAPVTSQNHKVYQTIDPLGLIGNIQRGDL